MRRTRAALLLCGFTLPLALLLGRLAQMQLVDHRFYADRAERKRLLMEILDAPRGRILDADARPIAWDEIRYDVAVVPAELDPSLRVARFLRRLGVLDGGPETLDGAAVAAMAASLEQAVLGACSEAQARRVEAAVSRWPARYGGLRTVTGSDSKYVVADARWLLQRLLVAERLAALSGVSADELARRIEKKRRRLLTIENAYQRRHEENSPQVIISDVGRRLAVALEMETKRLPGVTVVKGRRRAYAGEAFGNITGHMRSINPREFAAARGEKRLLSRGYNPPEVLDRLPEADFIWVDERVGACGIESAHERRLRGRKGAQLLEREIGGGGGGLDVLRELPPRPGNDLRLTIDADLQRAAYEALAEAGVRGAAVLLDPRTGAVLAMASRPSFDPTSVRRPEYWRRKSAEGAFLRRAASCGYAPGSVVKIVAAIAALAEDVVSPQESVNCRGYYRSPRAFRCWSYPRGHGPQNVSDAICHSCNVYFFEMAERLGQARLVSWLRRFGLGEKPSTDIPWANDGVLPDPTWKRRVMKENWYPGDTRMLAIGQGSLLVTPLQAARMTAAVATGRLVKARLLAETPVESRPLEVEPWILKEVREAMRRVVEDPSGTAHRTDLRRFHACAKTGTAEVDKKRGLNNAWIVGFAPAGNPEVAFAVLAERVSGHGGEVAGPVAVKILEAYFDRHKTAGR